MPSAGSSVAKPSRLTRCASMNRTRPTGRPSASAIDGTPCLDPDRRTRGRERVVLLATRAADADRTDHLTVVPQRDAAAEGDEASARGGVVARQVATGCDLVAEVEGGDPVARGGVRLVDGDRGAGELGSVHPPEGDQVTARVDHGGGHQAARVPRGVTGRAGQPLGQVEVELHADARSVEAWARSRSWIPPYAETPGR